MRCRETTMPKPVRAFACEWGCGRNVLMSRKRMAYHESRCFYNPARRACKSCGWWGDEEIDYQVASDTWQSSFVKACQSPEIESNELAADCPGWKPKVAAAKEQSDA